jgi:hypothetical protein
MTPSSQRAPRSPGPNRGKPARPDASRLVAGRYVLLEQLGAGGMGVVHLARDEAKNRVVAFKQLLASHAGRHRRLVETMFEREYHTLVRLKHPRVIEAYDYGVLDTGPFYTMELLPGGDLQQRSPLPYREVCAHLRDVASLLALLSTQRLVHRDVSPRNVRFAADGRAKLIDFGALTGFGRPSDIVGTPPCMAPEALGKVGLDQRTDLYALGAVAYFALTGRHAYPARRLDDLAELWRMPPAAPSSYAAEIPPELDRLVLSLLRADPLSRPSSAAAVLDELCAIGGLPAEEHAVAAESYLQSARIVGRQDEQSLLRKRLAQARTGTGGELLLDGARGAGKTRLLFEAALEAQLSGTTVLSADGQTSPQAFGVANALGLQLLTTHSELARVAAGARAPVLAHLSAELREKLGSPKPAALSEAAPERRAQLQGALHEWFLAFTDVRPILIAVDNLHAVDDNSAAFLAALGMDARRRNLLVLCTQCAGEPVRAPAPVRKLRDRGEHVVLTNLSNAACVDLVRAFFGDVPNAGRLAYVLHKRSGGNPQQLTELVRLLAKNEVVKYASGTWILPGEVNAEELPSDVEALSDARLLALGPDARSMLDILCIHDRPVAIELSNELAEGLSAARTHAALATLVTDQVLRLEDGRYRFARDAEQKARYERMPDALRVERHRRAAALFMTRTDDISAQLQACQHLLRAGDESEAAARIAPLARQLVASVSESLVGSEELIEVVHALQAALALYERQGRPPQVRSEPLFLMLSIGYWTSEWRLLYQHGVAAIELAADVLGLNLARRLRPALGGKLGLLTAALASALRFASVRDRTPGWGFLQALKVFFQTLPAVTGTILLSHDAESLERIRRLVEPLSWLGPKHPLTFLYNMVREQTHIARGLLHLTVLDAVSAAAALEDPAQIKTLGLDHVKSLRGAISCTAAILHSYASDPQALACADQAASLGIRIWQQGATQARVLYYAMRGESEAVQRYRAELELLAVQGGASWQVELALPTSLLGPEFLSADTVALRRMFEQLTRRALVIPAVQPYADAAEAMYLTSRGQLAEALAIYERVIPLFRPHERHSWMVIHSAYAQALNRSGQHARAKALLGDGLRHVLPEHKHFFCLYLEAERQLALAEAGLQHHQAAAAQLEALLATHQGRDNPLMIGLLHKASAEVALMAEDRGRFDRHFAALEGLFRGTRNPALIAQCEHLLARAVRAGMRTEIEARSLLAAVEGERSSAHISRMHAAAAPLDYLLRVVLDQSQAKAAHLYAYSETAGIRLLAASRPEEPPAHVESELREQADHVQAELRRELEAGEPHTRRETDSIAAGTLQRSATRLREQEPPPVEDHTSIVSAAPEADADQTHRIVVLRSKPGADLRVVGGLILELDPERPLLLPASLIAVVADALHGRGTVMSQ